MFRLGPTSTLIPYTTLFRSAGDPGESDDHERRGWSTRLAVATRGREGGTYATGDGHAGSFAAALLPGPIVDRSEETTSELQSLAYLVCRRLLEKKQEYLRPT